MKCIILAGGELGTGDPLHRYSEGRPKALISIGGKTLIEWVVDALGDAELVDEIAVFGLQESDAGKYSQSIPFFPDQGDMISNGLAGLEWALSREPDMKAALFCTADIPTITGPLIDEHLTLCQPYDKTAYYSFVSRETMESRFPGTDRTYARIDGMDVASCDLVVIRPQLAEVDRSLWDSLTHARKSPWKVAQVVGVRTLLRLLMGRMTFAQIERKAENILQQPVKVLLRDKAELAMDLDKPSHLDFIRAELE